MNTRQLVESYHKAWTSGEMSEARKFLADDLDFQGSIQTFNKADDFVTALRQFQGMVRGVTILQSYFSESGAALLYDCDTASPAGLIRTAEFFTIQDNKIVAIRLVFDATTLRKLMAG